MNILVVSDVFRNGGLETQLCTLRDNLPEGCSFTYAVGSYDETFTLEKAQVESGFRFRFAQTIQELVEDTQRLIDIIRQKKIDVLCVQPYYGLYAAVFAAQITRTPLTYTHHGATSFNFTKSPLESALFYHALERCAVSKVFSVSMEGIKAYEDLGYPNTCFFPNPIDLTRFPKITPAANSRWALISRLDNDKVVELKPLLLQLDRFGIEQLDVYGRGDQEAALLQFLQENNLEGKVKLCGFCSDVAQMLQGHYHGVIGIGRVVLEALCMGLPTILIGYGRLSGFIDREMFRRIRFSNFSNANLNYYNYTPPTKQMLSSIRRRVRKDFDAKKLTAMFVRELETAEFVLSPQFEKLFDELRVLADDPLWRVQPCFNARRLFDLERKYIAPASLQRETQALFSQADFALGLYDSMYYDLHQEAEKLRSELTSLPDKIDQD